MARTSKTKKQLIGLGVVIFLIVGALAYMVLSKSSGSSTTPPYQAPVVKKDFARSVFDNPEYAKLEPSIVKLPLDPGPKGRDNPFVSPSGGTQLTPGATGTQSTP